MSFEVRLAEVLALLISRRPASHVLDHRETLEAKSSR